VSFAAWTEEVGYTIAHATASRHPATVARRRHAIEEIPDDQRVKCESWTLDCSTLAAL